MTKAVDMGKLQDNLEKARIKHLFNTRMLARAEAAFELSKSAVAKAQAEFDTGAKAIKG